MSRTQIQGTAAVPPCGAPIRQEFHRQVVSHRTRVFNTRTFAGAPHSSQTFYLIYMVYFKVAYLRWQAINRPSIDQSAIHPAADCSAIGGGACVFVISSYFHDFWSMSKHRNRINSSDRCPGSDLSSGRPLAESASRQATSKPWECISMKSSHFHGPWVPPKWRHEG